MGGFSAEVEALWRVVSGTEAGCPFVLSFGVGREFTVDAESKWEPFVWTASSCHMLMEARERKHSPPTNPVGKLGLVLSRS